MMKGKTKTRSINMGWRVGKDIFAAAGDLKNVFGFVKGEQLILSEVIGDLADGDACRRYVKSVKHLSGVLEIRLGVVAYDLHPGYLVRRSTRDRCRLRGQWGFSTIGRMSGGC